VKKDSQNTVKRGLTLLLVFGMLSLAGAQYCKAAQLALMLQQSPVDGGSIEPGIGVHKVDRDTNITLRAVPQPGYQFVCWLGDVAEATASTTSSCIDSPKIIIAVFERVQYDSMAGAEALFNRPGGGLRPSAGDIVAQGGGGGGGKRPHKYYPPSWPEQEDEDDLEVPGEGDQLPVPEVPEPATVILLGLGTVFILRKKHTCSTSKTQTEGVMQ
jgi:hypothetical protein